MAKAKVHYSVQGRGGANTAVAKPSCGSRWGVPTATYTLSEDPDEVTCKKCREHGDIYRERVREAYAGNPKHLLVVRDLMGLYEAEAEAGRKVRAFIANIETFVTVPAGAHRNGSSPQYPYLYEARLPRFDHERHLKEGDYLGNPNKYYLAVDLVGCAVCSGGHTHDDDGHREDCALCAVEAKFADFSGERTESDLPFPGKAASND